MTGVVSSVMQNFDRRETCAKNQRRAEQAAANGEKQTLG